ncbi:hypothetical protein [Caulobacter vibrioides]|uniref:hypothetical protein n=1 Tax=Caulobacter vibrioides TaxID=155892 RepID=UPI000BB50FD2|nr:hypothetical protein [Caulobacter vibrioides]ATC25187.1 hypothetical protein CA608_11945 [Caulobacter vibrioides]PLR13958.1 hypothetical protein CVUC_05250 [Caulobacter vibrioides]
MVAPAYDREVERVANVLAALEATPTAMRSAALCVIDRVAEPRVVIGVFAGGRRFALDAGEVELTARVLTEDRPFAGSSAIANSLRARLGMAELLRFRANAVRMLTPMGRG